MARTKAFDEEAVLDKAVAIFWEKGYNATSAADLVKALGLSRSSIYGIFKDKRTLFILALGHYRKKQVASMLRLVRNSDNIPEIFRMIVDQDITAQLPKGCFMVNTGIELGPHDRQIADLIIANGADVEKTFTEALEMGQRRGQISKKHDPVLLARFLSNNISGLRVAVKSSQDRQSLDDVIELCLATLKP